MRVDLDVILSYVNSGAHVLDLGCGDGALLAQLRDKKNIQGVGLENDAKKITECIQKNIAVIEQDLNQGLNNFNDNSYDLVIMTLALQAMERPDHVLEDMLRIGKECIVTFPNFGHWRCRIQLLLQGTMPMAKHIPHSWYNTPNIHLCTFKDFEALCAHLKVDIIERLVVDANYEPSSLAHLAPNWLGPVAFYRLGRGKHGMNQTIQKDNQHSEQSTGQSPVK